MNETDHLSRRDFLGLALLGPAFAAKVGASPVDDRPIYRGSMGELISGILPAPDWHAKYFALVESVDAPVSEWQMLEMSGLALKHRVPLEGLPDLLRSHRIVRLCEADLLRSSDAPGALSCFADVFMFADVSTCEAQWGGLETRVAAGEADPHPGGIGDAACVGNHVGRWTLPGKIFFRRAIIIATIHVWNHVPGYEAHRFAFALDRRISALSR